MRADEQLLSWTFLEQIAEWSVAVAAVAVIAGFVITHSPTFVGGLALGGAFDIATLVGMVSAARKFRGSEWTSVAGNTGLLFALRLVGKAAILVAAALLPRLLDIWGTVIGVLIVDTTLLTVGSVKAVAAVWK